MGLMFLSRRRNKRSNVNLNHCNPVDLAPGNLSPVSFVRIVNGDSVRFQPKSFVQAFPMNAPLVNGFKLCLEYFFVPDRLYNVDLALDLTDTTYDPSQVKLPYIYVQPGADTYETDPEDPSFVTSVVFNLLKPEDTIQNIVAPGSLADFMNFPVGLFPTYLNEEDKKFNMLKMLGYLDIYYSYYVNAQIDTFPSALYGPARDEVHGDDPVSFKVEQLRDLLKFVKTSSPGTAPLSEWQALQPNAGTDRYLLTTWSWLCSRASIFQRCLPPYYLEAWLKTSGYVDTEIKVDLDEDGRSISFRNISQTSHVQRWMDLAMGGNGRYSDYLNNQFDVSRVRNSTSPIFLGSDRQYLGSKVIYQTTGFADSASPLGSFAGQASGGDVFKERTFKFGENGYFVVMASLVPDTIYYRGLDPMLRDHSLADLYVPALDNIAMQPLMVEELDAAPRYYGISKDTDNLFKARIRQDYNQIRNSAVGYVPAWSQYMQVVSRAHGRLTTELGYWLLRREYGDHIPETDDLKDFLARVAELGSSGKLSEADVETVSAFVENMRVGFDDSPYIRPDAYNDVFADVSRTARNFVLTFAADMTVNREKGKVNVSNTL